MELRDKLEQILKETFYEKWMDESEWKEFQDELFSQTGTSYESMEKDIKKGIENGYSEEFQLKAIKDYLNSIK